MSAQPTLDSVRPGLFNPLRNPDFRQLLGSNALWWVTAFMETLVFGWLVLEMTDSAWTVALVGFCRSLPFLLFGFMGGMVADRFGRRRVIVTAQAVNFAVYVSLFTLMLLGQLQIWHLGLGSAAIGCAWSFDWPARRALLPDLIGKKQTVEAMLLENFVQGCSRILGPFAAGLLIASAGAVGCLGVMCLLSGSALLSVRQLSKQSIPRVNMRPMVSPWSVLGQSLRYVGSNQSIMGVMLITVVLNMLMIPYMTLLPVFARDVLHQGPVGLGLLSLGAGAGSFIGLFLISKLRRYLSNGWILTGGTFGMALALVAFSQSSAYGFSWGMLVIAGVGQACFGIMQSSIILLTASDEMRGQTMGILVLAIGSDPFGKLITGALAETSGAPFAVGLQAGVAALLLAVIAVTLPGLRERHQVVHERT
ncbi:MAG: MFS transporter [Caldilineaceae bacterium]|nr:MFS transporter [Caldilineaceae bacterium]